MKIAKWLVTSVVLFSFFTVAQPYKEGEHYTKISDVKPVQREVREYFSLLCPHCYALEKRLPSISMPEGVAFNRTHVDFLRGTDPAIQSALSRGYVVARQQGVGDAFVHAWFARIHDKRTPPLSEQEILTSLVDVGIPADKVSAYYNSQLVRSESQSMQSDQELMVEQGVLKGVPSLIVNGRYIIHLNALNRQAFNDDLSALIAYLSKKE